MLALALKFLQRIKTNTEKGLNPINIDVAKDIELAKYLEL